MKAEVLENKNVSRVMDEYMGKKNFIYLYALIKYYLVTPTFVISYQN